MFHPKGPSLVELVQQGLCSVERGYDLLAPRFEYLTFPLPRARALLEARGFTVDARRDALPEPYSRHGLRGVSATRS